MKTKLNFNHTVEVEKCNIDYLMVVLKQLLVCVLTDFMRPPPSVRVPLDIPKRNILRVSLFSYMNMTRLTAITIIPATSP